MSGPLSRRQFLAMAAFAAVVPYGCTRTEELTVSRHTVRVHQLPPNFSGFTICHLTDLHSREYGPGNRELLKIIEAEEPDLIAMTGDMVDWRKCNLSVCLDLCVRAATIAPTKYVTGNHEMMDQVEMIQDRIIQSGADLLDNRCIQLKRGGDAVCLAGAGERDFYGRHSVRFAMRDVPRNVCSIILSHHPEQMSAFAERGANLILAGHTHGGQVKMPGVGALIAPDQGLLPKYSEGFYHEDATTMFISRGLGNSIIPFRLNCPPEVVFLTLEPAA